MHSPHARGHSICSYAEATYVCTTSSEDAEGFFRSFPHLRKASSEEAFRIFGRSLPIFRRSLPNFRRSLPICGEAALQAQVRKIVPKGDVIFFKTCTVSCLNTFWHAIPTFFLHLYCLLLSAILACSDGKEFQG